MKKHIGPVTFQFGGWNGGTGRARRPRGVLLVVILLVAVLGVAGLALTHAASGVLSAEAESGQVTAPAKVVADSSASGGKAVQFTAATACPSGQMGTPPDCVPTPPAPLASGKTWKLNFAEEFNGSDYDHNKLTPCFDWNSGNCTSSFNQGREHYMPSQVTVSGGSAHLTAAPLNPPYADSACQNGKCTYKSGLLSTARPNASSSKYLYTFTYGYVESAFKVIGTQGFFTAFWMLPANTSYNYRSEIDIVENLGYDPTTIYMTYHYNDRSQSDAINTATGNNGSCPVLDYSKAYHRFGMDWEPDHVAWYIDGVKCGQFNGNTSTVENGPMQLIMDLMVDHSWERQWGKGLLDPTLTRTLDVDYIRVYQQS